MGTSQTAIELTIQGSHGIITTDREGNVLEYVPDGKPKYSDIARIDWAEYRQWAAKVRPEWVNNSETDIILVGYWTKEGGYFAASIGDREGVLTAAAESDANKREANKTLLIAENDTIPKVLAEMRDRHLHNGFKLQTLIGWADRIDHLLNGTALAVGDGEITDEVAGKLFTVFVVDADGNHSTTFITSVEATSLEDAERMGCEEAAEAWEQDVSEVRLLGVAAGEVEILDWHDEGGGD